MKKIYNIASAFCVSALGLMLMTSCEGGEIYSVETPDWLQAKIDSIAYEKELHKNDEPAEKTVFINPVILGAVDNTSGFRAVTSDNVKVAPNQTVYSSFVNFSSCAGNWNNFLLQLCKSNGEFYVTCRADNWVLDMENDALVKEPSWTDWDAWRMAMDGAKVDAAVKNNGDGTAEVSFNITGNNGETYTLNYKEIKGIDADDLYFNYTVDGCHLVFDKFFCPAETTLGATDNTSGYLSVTTEMVKLEPGQSVVSKFINNTAGLNNWNNFNLQFCAEDGTGYFVLRADRWMNDADNDALDANKVSSWTDWAAWLADMVGATVTATVTNHGDGTVSAHFDIKGASGQFYTMYYNHIPVPDANNVCCRYTVDSCHLVFSESL